MITIDVVGGLGNQLFKIFAVIAYSLEYKLSFLFEYKEVMLNRHTYWNSFLKRLKIFTTAIPVNETTYCNSLRQNNVVIHAEHPTYKYIEIPDYPGKSVFLKGYFQSPLYFESYKDKIYQIIGLAKYQSELKQQFVHYFEENIETISMHFRLGDYKNLPQYHPIIPFNYYEKSLTLMCKKLSKPCRVLYFCEQEDNDYVVDSIQKLKQIHSLEKIDFVKVDDSIDDWKQIIIMSLCDHNIIANSTFSWWGAYFGNPKNRCVCYPNIWFGPALKDLKTSQMFPSVWQKIDCD